MASDQHQGTGEKRIPISAAEKVATQFGLQQCLLIGWDGERAYVVTYGKTKADCDAAAKAQDFWTGRIREFSFTGAADAQDFTRRRAEHDARAADARERIARGGRPSSHRFSLSQTAGTPDATQRAEPRSTDQGSAERRGDWMETASGRKLWPLDIRPGDVHPEDVAHGLAMTCRYGGHTGRFYSVAEHCCRLADYVLLTSDYQFALDLLTHDAAEAFLGDIPRPLKRAMPAGWKEIEEAADRACAAALGARYPFLQAVKDLDSRILVDERAALMSLSGNAWDEIERLPKLGVPIEAWPPEQAKEEWMGRYERLRAALTAVQSGEKAGQ